MQKGKTVKTTSFLIMILLLLASCQQAQKSNDQVLLALVLQQKQHQFSKPIYLHPTGKSNAVETFFKLRKTKNRALKVIYHDTISPSDTITPRKGKPVYKDIEITTNNYLAWGKGIDEKAEAFLKDSFNYRQEKTIQWTIPKSLEKILTQDQVKDDYSIKVSAPVYNLDNNKVIMFTFLKSSNNTAQQSIYFIEKNDNYWHIIYVENNDLILD